MGAYAVDIVAFFFSLLEQGDYPILITTQEKIVWKQYTDEDRVANHVRYEQGDMQVG